MKIFYAGLDIGGTNVKLGIFSAIDAYDRTDRNRSLQTSYREEFPVPGAGANLASVLVSEINKGLKAVKDEVSKSDVPGRSNGYGYGADEINLTGVGIAIAANCRPDGTVIGSTNLSNDFTGLKKRIEQAFGCPVYLANDADLAAAGEYACGAAQGSALSMTVTLGTGVGVGIVSGGQLLSGAHSAIGEIGHIKMFSSDEIFLRELSLKYGASPSPEYLSMTEHCGCGGEGCLEQYCSAQGMVRIAGLISEIDAIANGKNSVEEVESENKYKTPIDVFQAAEAGDTIAAKAIDEYCDILGRGIAAMSCVLDPYSIVISGGVSNAGKALMKPLQAAFETYAYPLSRTARLKQGKFGSYSGIWGAAVLASSGITGFFRG
ncbi:MAG: ROK family protein [Eubacteriales bacterium]|nr:ROK family protein [Eubacteriales bacterium]